MVSSNLVIVDELTKLLRNKWDINIGVNEHILFDMRYSWRLPVACTQLDGIERDAGIARIKFLTSFGIFHQPDIDYNQLLVVLLENVNGALKSLHFDLVISAYSYPDVTSRRQISCSPRR